MFTALLDKAQISAARAELVRRGLSALESGLTGLARKFRILRSIPVGDELKSWDVLETLKFIESKLLADAPILDIGAFASEIPLVLLKAGYLKVNAIDLNPRIKEMPLSKDISYHVGDFMATPFGDDSFDAITAISVIEHGFNPAKLLSEVERILRPGGYFIASVDFWPQKIDTADHPIFGMSWTIFSTDEIAAFLQLAASRGLSPVGLSDYHVVAKPIDHAGRSYTFGWLVLRKSLD